MNTNPIQPNGVPGIFEKMKDFLAAHPTPERGA
jgi:hypothetical protein